MNCFSQFFISFFLFLYILYNKSKKANVKYLNKYNRIINNLIFTDMLCEMHDETFFFYMKLTINVTTTFWFAKF